MRSAALLMLSLLIVGCGTLEPYTETRMLMGTDVEITVLHADETVARAALEDAFRAIDSVNSLMSTYRADSPLSQLNSDKVLNDPPAELLFVLNRSLYYSVISDGAFDTTVAPLLDLYSETFRDRGRPPTDDEIEEAKTRIGYGRMVLTRDALAIEEGMTITLGGIAKGYAIDKAISALEKQGIRHALVNAGGDLRALGEKGGSPWLLALQNPRDPDDYIALLAVGDVSIATSGDYERYFDPDRSAHHIMDPRTGRSAGELMSVTIISPHAINADAMATAVFVLGPERGLALIERFSNAEGLLITTEREIIRSSGFDAYLN